jgi:tRNA-dependent cyclodipeptide synthase
VRGLAQWAVTNFRTVHALTWEEPYVWSLEALGYSPDHAKHKAHKAFRNLWRRAVDAFAAVGIAQPQRHVITWPVLNDNPAYRRLRAEVYRVPSRRGLRHSVPGRHANLPARTPLAGQPIAGRTG